MLYVVATPIGNLKDITLRALETLRSVDLILCEDTRQTQKLLNHYEIKKPTISYHQHSDEKKLKEIKKILETGKSVALVTDAGTPGISDPGNRLIQKTIEQLNNLTIIPIPGPCALTTALSVSGLPTDKFVFLGFPPAKNKRQRFFGKIIESGLTVVFYESGRRILKTLEELKNLLNNQKNAILNKKRPIVVGRELTKQFETIYRGDIEEVLEKIKKDSQKGEFVIIVG